MMLDLVGLGENVSDSMKLRERKKGRGRNERS
jgi:hypothetical protein